MLLFLSTCICMTHFLPFLMYYMHYMSCDIHLTSPCMCFKRKVLMEEINSELCILVIANEYQINQKCNETRLHGRVGQMQDK